MDAEVFTKRLYKMMGTKKGIHTLERVALRVAQQSGLSVEEAAELVVIGYKAVLFEFKQEGILRLPFGAIVRPRSTLTDKIKNKFLCSNWNFDTPDEVKNDPPFTMFHSAIITALMALEIEDELWLTHGLTPADLAKQCIHGIE